MLINLLAKIVIENPDAYDFHVLRISGLPIIKTNEEKEKRIEKLTQLLKPFSSNDKVKIKIVGFDTVYAFFPINSNDGIFARACLHYETFENLPLQIHIAHTFKKKEEMEAENSCDPLKVKSQPSYRKRYGNSNYFDRDKNGHPSNSDISWRPHMTRRVEVVC
jgi:hypothetical protein